MPTLSEYEAKHLRNLDKLTREMKALYYRYIDKMFMKATGLRLREGATYDLNKFPALKRSLDELFAKMAADMKTTIVNGIKQEWALSNAKNDDWMKLVIGDRSLPVEITQRFFDTNLGAMNEFINRRRNGITLSDNIWNKATQLRQEVEATLQDGITNGRSAASMATELKVNLKNPDMIFRRVKDKYGKLQLSKAAQDYHPLKGKYRSSYRNALRLARNEVNSSYRLADCARWKRTKFVLGFEVKLSASHKIYDICDLLTGKYPSDFKFQGWHVSCLCFAVPIRPSEDEFGEYLDSIIDGTEPPEFTQRVEQPPAALNTWIKDNEERVKGWKSKPLFISDNAKYVK